MAAQTSITRFASLGVRLTTILFFRMFPAILPNIALAFFAVYVPSFFYSYKTEPEIEVIQDKTNVTIEETPKDAKIVVTEEIMEAEKEVKPWKILAYGSGSRKHPLASIATFFINVVLMLLTADAVLRVRWFYPVKDLSFVRVGHVSQNEASFLIREPDQAKMPLTLEIHIKDAKAPFENPLWQTVGGVRWTSNDTDYTATLTVPLTHPEQRQYEWRTSNNHSGAFLGAPKPGKMPTYHDGKFTFLSTSCILPRFPYNPLDHPLAIPGARHLAAKLPQLGAQFMLFLGDFIYVDVPQRFGKSVEDYREQYRQVYASPEWAPMGQNLSWIHVLDDHEISNDWSANSTGLYNNAVQPWHTYQANVNPPRALAAGLKVARAGATWYEFVQGPAAFFMMDTRSYRSSNSLPFEEQGKTMLGQEQLEDLLAWLARPMPRGVRWRVIASSVPFTKNWPVNNRDTWGGFLVERRKVLEAMWDAGVAGTSVVVLSGDRHEFAATRFPPPPDSRWPESAAAHEFSTSPLNQFASPIPTYKQKDGEDVMLNYIPSGSSKFGAFTIEKHGEESTLQFRLFIDGKERWEHLLTAPPEKEAPSWFSGKGFFT